MSDDVVEFDDVEPSSSDDERTIIMKHGYTKRESPHNQGYRRIPTSLSWKSRDKRELKKRQKTLSKSPHESGQQNARKCTFAKSFYSRSRSSHGKKR